MDEEDGGADKENAAPVPAAAVGSTDGEEFMFYLIFDMHYRSIKNAYWNRTRVSRRE